MRFLDLYISGFGKFHDTAVSFEDGLNVIYGKNEAGKSTIHTFIRGMLFGIERQRGRAARNDIYSKYEPWENSGTYEGQLRLESDDGTIYRIERSFQKNKKEFTVINETTGREEPDCWRRFAGNFGRHERNHVQQHYQHQPVKECDR